MSKLDGGIEIVSVKNEDAVSSHDCGQIKLVASASETAVVAPAGA